MYFKLINIMCSQLYDFKCPYQILIVFKLIYFHPEMGV